jgi:glucokinase
VFVSRPGKPLAPGRAAYYQGSPFDQYEPWMTVTDLAPASPIIGIDIGGTAVKLGLVSKLGEIISRRTIPFRTDWSFEACAAAIGDEVAALLVDSEPAAIGIGIPAYPHPETGALMAPVPNVPPLATGSLKAAFAVRFRLPVMVGNDGVCAAQAELDFGAGRAFRRFAVLTLGTGIGGAIIIDRRVIDGPHGLPPEIGAISLDPSRTDVPDVVPGAFEYLASAAALLRRYQQLAGDQAVTTPREIFDRAKEGEALALQVVDENGRWIAQVVGILSNLLNLEAVILGGGLSHAGPFLLEQVERHAKHFYWAPFGRPPKLLLAERGNDAGIIGAAAIGFAGLAERR